MKSREELRKRLLLENKPGENGYSSRDFSNDLNYYFFRSNLMIGKGGQEEVFEGYSENVLFEPEIEENCRTILQSRQVDSLMKELFFHLQRSRMKFPGAILPEVLTAIRNSPGLWRAVYNNCHDLARDLVVAFPQWMYYTRAFDPEAELVVGSYQFYECIQFRMLLFPVSTEALILEQFDGLSSHHQAKLIKVLELGQAPHLVDFFRTRLSTGNKEVRVSALEALLRLKDEEVYGPLVEWVRKIYGEGESVSYERVSGKLNLRINDLKALTEDGALRERLLQVVDPGDWQTGNESIVSIEEKGFILRGACFHRNQPFLVDWVLKYYPGIRDVEIVEYLSAGSCAVLMDAFVLQDIPWGSEVFKGILDKIYPFLNRESSEEIWKHLRYQLSEFFFHDFIPLDTIMSKIHPNFIRDVLYDGILQGDEEWKLDARRILNCRLEIIKKIYPK